jgi:hypothetical protein
VVLVVAAAGPADIIVVMIVCRMYIVQGIDRVVCLHVQINQPKGPAGLKEVREAHEYALSKVGQDVHAGPMWMEFISFLMRPRSGDPVFTAIFGPAPPGQEETLRVTAVRCVPRLHPRGKNMGW